MSDFLYQRVLLDAQASAAFSDAALLDAMLRVEVELARAQAQSQLIPVPAAQTIERAAATFAPNIEQLVRDGAHAGSLAIAYVDALVRHVANIDTDAARYVHFGATSQDVLDTALALGTRTALSKLDTALARCRTAARALATRHARTAMLARTLLQPAGVTTFGLKAAHWALAIHHTHQRILASAPAALAVSLGGAVGSLSAFGEHGAAVRARLATALNLSDAASWHTRREQWIALASDTALAAGACSKIANDIALMTQFEIGEVAEPHAAGRGGSSAMPHKRNPVLSMRVLAATQAVPSLIAQLLTAMRQEHERALGNWQAESAAWPRVFTHTVSAAVALAELLEGLEVNTERCRENLDRLQGVLSADRLAQCWAAQLGKLDAHNLAAQLAQQALQEQQPLNALAKRHATSDARLTKIAAADIDACFAQDETIEICAQQALSMVKAMD